MAKWTPPAENLPNIIDRLKEGIVLPLFFQILHTTEYSEKLTEKIVTMFVPSEDTLDILSVDQIAQLQSALKDEKKAKEIVENHLINTPISLKEMLAIKELTTLSGKKISIDVSCNIREDYEFSLDNACYVHGTVNNNKIETANIVCFNGFIHIIKGIVI